MRRNGATVNMIMVGDCWLFVIPQHHPYISFAIVMKISQSYYSSKISNTEITIRKLSPIVINSCGSRFEKINQLIYPSTLHRLTVLIWYGAVDTGLVVT